MTKKIAAIALAEAWNKGYAQAARHSASGTLGSQDPGNPYRGDPEPSEAMCSNAPVGFTCFKPEGHTDEHVGRRH